MPKATLSIIRLLLNLILKSFEKVVALIITIIDLVDDGVINESYTAPEWINTMKGILHLCKDVIEHLDNIRDEVADTVDRSQETPVGNA